MDSEFFYEVKNALDPEQSVYRGGCFDLKQSIIAISALLNSSPSATLHVYARDWDLQHTYALLRGNSDDDSYAGRLRFIADVIQRAIFPKVTVEFDDKLPEWKNVSDIEGRAKFTITGGTPPYSAYGQYYMQKDGEICPMEDSNYVLPETPEKPIVNIGPRTKQTEYIETFADLDYGIYSLKAIRNQYPCATLYIGVKEDGTVIDPRPVEEAKNDITEAVLGYMKAKDFLKPCDGSSFNVDKIGGIGVVQLILGGQYHQSFWDYHDFYTESNGRYVRDNFKIHKLNDQKNWYEPPHKQYSLYELESPTRNLSFVRLEALLADNGIRWDDFETKFGVSLLNGDNRYNMFAYLLSDATEQHVCAPHITSIKLKLYNHLQFWDSKERWFFERIADILGYIRSLNRLRTINIDGEKAKFEYFDFEDAKEAYLCACIYHDWASQYSPAIELTTPSLIIYCLPVLHEGENGELVPEKNELLARLMKMYGLIEDTDVSFARLQEKFGPKSISYGMQYPKIKNIRIRLPIGKRVKNGHINNKGVRK